MVLLWPKYRPQRRDRLNFPLIELVLVLEFEYLVVPQSPHAPAVDAGMTWRSVGLCDHHVTGWQGRTCCWQLMMGVAAGGVGGGCRSGQRVV